MADGGEWIDAFVADPDEVFERDLAQRARQREFLFDIYISGFRYGSASIATLRKHNIFTWDVVLYTCAGLFTYSY
jgi:hypothetical protein